MQAFNLYHPGRENNDELKDKFIALRTSRNNYVRSLYRRHLINPDQLEELLRLIHICDYEELVNIFAPLKAIPTEGYNFTVIKSRVRPKEVTPIYRKRTSPNLTTSTFPELQGLTREELQLRHSFICKGKRLLSKRQSLGLITYEEKERILGNTLSLRTSLDAQNWYHALMAETFVKSPRIPYCEHCEHCQALRNNASNAFAKEESESEEDFFEGEDEADI